MPLKSIRFRVQSGIIHHFGEVLSNDDVMERGLFMKFLLENPLIYKFRNYFDLEIMKMDLAALC